jgi:hypothetical protein
VDVTIIELNQQKLVQILDAKHSLRWSTQAALIIRDSWDSLWHWQPPAPSTCGWARCSHMIAGWCALPLVQGSPWKKPADNKTTAIESSTITQQCFTQQSFPTIRKGH